MNNREWVRTDGMALVRGDDLIMYVSVCVCVNASLSVCACTVLVHGRSGPLLIA